jgi:S-adenosylhomocysteine hydrolase
MSNLLLSDNTWFLDKHLDIEYQTYRLLACLQYVEEQFAQMKLYPYLSELIRHYEFVDNISTKMEEVKQRLNIELNDEITEYIYEMSNIIKNKTKTVIDDGINLFNIVLKSIKHETIGIVPEYNQEGYIIASYEKVNYLDIMRFHISNIIDYDKFYITGIDYLESLDDTSILRRVPEFIKDYILAKYRDLPNPIVIYIKASYYVPLHETLIPIIKRVLPVWIQAV